jgi:peptidyl-prolyl cis-trans isomerase B (cyclophilin B)
VIRDLKGNLTMRTPKMTVVAISAAMLICTLIFSTSPLLAQTTKPKGQDAPKKDKPEKPTAQAASKADAAIAVVSAYIEKNSTGDAPKINKKSPTWKTKLPKFPELNFTSGAKYYWDLETSQGAIRIQFMPKNAPKHVSNFIYLTEVGFFDGISFHRVIPGFMAQGGCPIGNGRGNPGYKFSGEYLKENGVLKVKHTKPGTLSMANAGAGTDGSQFFITFAPTAWLDGKHTVFGEVTQGMDTVKKLESFGTAGSGRPKEALKILKATIVVE